MKRKNKKIKSFQLNKKQLTIVKGGDGMIMETLKVAVETLELK